MPASATSAKRHFVVTPAHERYSLHPTRVQEDAVNGVYDFETWFVELREGGRGLGSCRVEVNSVPLTDVPAEGEEEERLSTYTYNMSVTVPGWNSPQKGIMILDKGVSSSNPDWRVRLVMDYNPYRVKGENDQPYEPGFTHQLQKVQSNTWMIAVTLNQHFTPSRGSHLAFLSEVSPVEGFDSVDGVHNAITYVDFPSRAGMDVNVWVFE